MLFLLLALGLSRPPSRASVSGIALVHIPPGTFAMGSAPGEPGRQPDESLHRVTISRGFWLGTTEVTQAQWTRIMGANPSRFSGCPRCPVESVTWFDVRKFLERLNEKVGGGFRLPTEAEWEYACRTGEGSEAERIDDANANFDARYPLRGGRPGRYLGRPVPVGSFPADRRGIFDMHGNVWEWCSDGYGAYPTHDVTDPVGPASAEKKVIRGGSWYFDAASCRCSARYSHASSDKGFSVGFRLARDER
ncbi:MAG: formylglycine-generating enzyme family protein [Thermoanaerobaculia bacterium]